MISFFSLGCDIGFGLLHRIPLKPEEIAQAKAHARAVKPHDAHGVCACGYVLCGVCLRVGVIVIVASQSAQA